jgi:hypothetical protein
VSYVYFFIFLAAMIGFFFVDGWESVSVILFLLYIGYVSASDSGEQLDTLKEKVVGTLKGTGGWLVGWGLIAAIFIPLIIVSETYAWFPIYLIVLLIIWIIWYRSKKKN